MTNRILLLGFILTFIVIIAAFILPDNNPTSEQMAYAAPPTIANEAQYIGVAQCVICHRTDAQGRQEAIWRESLHARAFETLETDQSVAIAREMGITAAPHEAPECLVCHATGWDLPAERLGNRFNIEDGVQCETCHGAGSEYRAIHGRDPEAGKARGLIVGRGDADACIACHNEKSPTYKGFDFERDMARIAHPVPN
jgi:hypothetical protein